jgi:dephospho-CoA kinase
MAKLVVGLTGGIASGKSTVGRILSEQGVVVIDADELARDVAAPGTFGFRELVRCFGAEYVQEDGYLDRQKLGALVFTDYKARSQLNGIMHPLIHGEAQERIWEAQRGPTPYVVYDAALHVEMGTYKALDKLIVVAAEPSLQIRRMVKRNGFTEAEAESRLASQLPLSEKLKVADYVIQNDNDKEALVRRTLRTHQLILGL